MHLRCLVLEQKLATMTRKFKSKKIFLGNFLAIFCKNKKQLAANKVIFVEFTLKLGVIVGVILFEKSFQRRVLHL